MRLAIRLDLAFSDIPLFTPILGVSRPIALAATHLSAHGNARESAFIETAAAGRWRHCGLSMSQRTIISLSWPIVAPSGGQKSCGCPPRPSAPVEPSTSPLIKLPQAICRTSSADWQVLSMPFPVLRASFP